ncbi:MAG: hypothetical protein AABX12_03180 [Nanoarchaeota archaeon]
MTTTPNIEKLVEEPDRRKTKPIQDTSFDKIGMKECMEISVREIVMNLVPGYTLWRTSQNNGYYQNRIWRRLALATGIELAKAAVYGVAGYSAYYLIQ